MKNIFSALFFSLFGATALMTSCSDVPAPYEIMSPGDIELVGDGSKDNPYNVATAAMKQDGSTAWVQGYIVGVMETNVAPFSPNFAAPFNTESNLMIADSPEEQNKKNCIIVQLPVGDIRTALNLKAHADNLGKPVSLQGKLTAYFSSNGLKEVSAATFNGEEIGNGEGGEVVPPAPGEDPFGLDASKTSTEFTADFEDITDFNQVYTKEGWVNKALAKGNPWQTAIYNKKDKYLKMNTYNTQEGDKVESWFITPAFVVGNKSKLSFDCAGANFTTDMHLKVFFLQKDASGKVSQEEIIVNEIPTSGSNYAWAKDINVDLSKYNGKTGFVGFQYTATGNGSTKGLPTYQIDNIKYSGENEGGEVVPPTPGEDKYTSNITLEGGQIISNTYIEKANIENKEYDVIKIGTGKKPGAWVTPNLQAGATSISFYGIAWKDKPTQLTLSIEGGGSFDNGEQTQKIEVAANEGATANAPYTFTLSDNDYKSFKLKGVTANTTIKFTTENGTNPRVIFLGINVK